MSRLNNDVSTMEQVSAGALGELNRVVEMQLFRSSSSNGIGPFSVPAPALSTATSAQIMSGLYPSE